MHSIFASFDNSPTLFSQNNISTLNHSFFPFIYKTQIFTVYPLTYKHFESEDPLVNVFPLNYNKTMRYREENGGCPNLIFESRLRL